MKSVHKPDRKTLHITEPMRSDVALRMIWLRELEIMEFNEICYIRQHDIECLHDFRVAMRRSRILLSRVQGVFPKRELNRFNAGFVRLGRLTGPCRDLDVLLEHWSEYAAASDPASKQVFDYLQTERGKLSTRVIAEFTSVRHAQFKMRWHEFLLVQSAARRLPFANQPISVTANELVEKVLHKIARKIKKTDDKSSDRKIHKLRIFCKRLRYLLDYFQAFSAIAQHQKLITEMKKLQDNLGEFQDLIVQRTVFMSLEAEMTACGFMDEDVRQAVQAMEKVLDERIPQQRTLVLAAIQQFLSRTD